MGLVASVWRPGEHPGGHGGTYGTSSQFCEDGSLAKRTKLVAQIFHLPVANRTGPLTQDGAVVFLRASGVLKQKQLCGRTRVILLPSPTTRDRLANALAGAVLGWGPEACHWEPLPGQALTSGHDIGGGSSGVNSIQQRMIRTLQLSKGGLLPFGEKNIFWEMRLFGEDREETSGKLNFRDVASDR